MVFGRNQRTKKIVQSTHKKIVQSKNAQKKLCSQRTKKIVHRIFRMKLKNFFDFVVYKHILLCYNEYTLNRKVVKNMYYYGTTTDGWTVLSYDNELLVDTGVCLETYVSNIFGEIIK